MNIECRFCDEIIETPITDEDLDKYYSSDQHIQYSLPHIPAEYREMLISGMCPICWNKTFGSEED